MVRTEHLRLWGNTIHVTGELLSKLGQDGWSVTDLTVAPHDQAAAIGTFVLFMQRPSAEHYERQRAQWIDALKVIAIDGNDPALYTPRFFVD